MAVTTTIMRLAAQQQPSIATTRRGSRAAARTKVLRSSCPRTGAGRSSASIPGRTTYRHAKIALVTRASRNPEKTQQSVSGVPQPQPVPQITLKQPTLVNIREAWPKEHQGYLWTLEVDRTWCEESRDHAMMCEFVEPLMLTNAIDTHRTGPNQTGEMYIGRDESQCDIKLFDAPYMSERHACFEEDGDTGHLFVTDLESVNGTFLNGERLEANTKTELHPGDTVSFGKVLSPLFVVQRDIKVHA